MAENIFESTNRHESFFRRVSWGAIFAGVVVVLITQLMLTLLGVAFGAASIAPLQEENPLSGLGMGSAIWLAVSTLIALFSGGWVAARLAVVPDRTESTLHGVVTWGLSSLAAMYLITTAATGIVSSAAGVVGKTAGLLGQGAQAVGPDIAKAVGDQLGIDNVSWNQVKEEAAKLMRQTGDPALQPKAIQRQAESAASGAESAAKNMASDPQSIDSELAQLWQRIETRGSNTLEAIDKQDLTNVLVARTKMSEAEAAATVDRWEQTLNQAGAQIAQVKEQAVQKGREIADSTAGAVSKAAAWSFVGLLIGLISSALGGFFGAPRGAEPFRFRQQRLDQAA